MSTRIVWVLASVSFLLSCNKQTGYQKTANGLEYRIITDAKQPKAQAGQVIKYHLFWRTDKDSLVLDTRSLNKPYYSRIDKPKYKGDPMEILSMLGAGDSASTRVPADLLFQGSPVHPFAHGDFVKMDFKVLEVMSEDDYDLMVEKENKTESS